MRPAAAAWILLAAASLGGCSDAPATSTATAPADDLAPQNSTAEPVALPTMSRDWYLDAGGGLSEEVPREGRVAFGTGVQGFVLGIDPPTFVSDGFDVPMRIETEPVILSLHVSFDEGAVSNTAFDIGAWFGTERMMPLSTSTTIGTAVTPGGTSEVTLTMEWDALRPVIVPAGEALRLVVTGPFSGPAGVASGDILVGPDTPSRVNVTWTPYAEDPLDRAVEQDPFRFSGSFYQVPNVDCADPATGPHEFSIDVSSEAVWLAAEVAANGVPGARDIDLFLRDGATTVAASRSPGSDDGLFVAADALEGLRGRTLTLHVRECAIGSTDYVVTVTQGAAPPADAAA